MFTKNLKDELTLEELRRVQKAISYEVAHNEKLTEEEKVRLWGIFRKVLYD